MEKVKREFVEGTRARIRTGGDILLQNEYAETCRSPISRPGRFGFSQGAAGPHHPGRRFDRRAKERLGPGILRALRSAGNLCEHGKERTQFQQFPH
jgi:hypothetical protein